MLLAKLELNGCEGDFRTIDGKILWKVTTKEKLISLKFDGIRDGMNSLILNICKYPCQYCVLIRSFEGFN